MTNISPQRLKLLCELERIVGNSFYNDFIQNWENWEYVDEGREFRYPLTYIIDDLPNKTKDPSQRLTEINALSGHYKLGANELLIMHALNQVIEHLKKLHGFNFKEDLPPAKTLNSKKSPKSKSVEKLPSPAVLKYRENSTKGAEVKLEGIGWIPYKLFKKKYNTTSPSKPNKPD